MSRLREAEIRVALIRGNHDAASRITKYLRLPENVFELSHRKPETLKFDDLGIVVHGQSFATRAVTEDLAASYPQAVPGLFNVGLLHTCATGREGHDAYAPCSVDTLIAKGYDYWALGHVHQREILSEDPWIVFPGNLQGRHARETGPKGATLIDVDDGRVARVQHVALDVVRWMVCEIDATETTSPDDVMDLARERLESVAAEAGDRTLAVRLRLTGTTRAHEALEAERDLWEQNLRAVANDIGAEGLWLEKVRFDTVPTLDPTELAGRDVAIGQLVRGLRAALSEPGLAEALLDEFSELKRKLPHQVGEGDDPVRLDDPTLIREALADVERMLLPRLLWKRSEE
jgi:DNA repair exonuclease SbcCD nuclease subunit